MKLDLNRISQRRLSADSGRAILDLLIETVYLAVIFLVPLWFAYLFPTYNIFEFNKLAVFKILVWLLFLFTALKLIFFRAQINFAPVRFFKKYWLWPLIFIAGLSLSLLASVNPLLSFYGSIERQGGLVSYLFFFFWFILAAFNILTIDNQFSKKADSKDKRIRRAVSAAVISASAVSIYGLLQILNIDFIVWPESAFTTHRIFSTLGQPNFLASWLLLVIPLSLYLGFSSRRFLAKFFYLLAAALQIICLVFTGSRGGLLALVFIAALYLTYLLVSSSWPRRQKIFLSLGFIGLAAVFLVAVDNVWPGRISSLLDYQSGSIAARANFYSAAADSIQARPWLGYGLESGSDIFIKYYEPDWAIYGDVGQSADRAHNIILDIILSTGFYGLVLFAALYYFFFSLARDNIKKKRSPFLSLSLALGAAAYLFSLLFSFSIVSGEIYFWLFLALLAVINYDPEETVESRNSRPRFERIKLPVKIIFALVVIVLAFWRISWSFRSLIADYYFNKIYYTLENQDYFTALVLDGYLKEQKANPVNQESYDDFWGEKLSESYPFITELAPKKAVADKLEEINRSLPSTGYKNLSVKARINDTLGHYQAAQAYLDRLIALAPHWPLAYMEQGKLASNQGDLKGALIAYNLTLLNLPSIKDSRLNDPHRELIQRYQYFVYYRIGEIYEREKNYAAAEKYFQLAYGSDPSDFVLLKRIADMEYRRGNLGKAIEYTKRGLMRSPGDYKWTVALASLYYERGDKKTALEYLEKALALAPGNQEILDLKRSYEK